MVRESCSRWRHAASDLLAVAYRDERAGFDRAETPWRHVAVTWAGGGQSLAVSSGILNFRIVAPPQPEVRLIVAGSPNMFVCQGSCASRWGSVLWSGNLGGMVWAPNATGASSAATLFGAAKSCIAFQYQPPRTGRRYIGIQRQTHRFLQLRVIPAAPPRSRPRGEGLGEELQVLT